MKKRMLLLAGEESGLIYANRLREALCATGLDFEFRTYATEGFHTADLAVMGFVPVLMKIFYFLRVARTMKRVIRTWKPDAVVTVDYPGLNLRLAAFAKARGIPAIHLVCPQVWAWHRNRIPKVAAALTKLLCFFPFEPDLFEGTGLPAVFIGHPLADICAGDAPVARRSGLVAVLPGSRIGEISRILPRLLEAVKGLEYRIPAANEKTYREILKYAPAERVQMGGARELLRAADCAAVASGTATLEAALARCPTVLVYAVSRGLAWFARRVIRGISHIGLANVIAEKTGLKPPMPELLQEAFTPEAVRAQLEAWLAQPQARAAVVEDLDAVMRRLQSSGHALDVAAREIVSCMSK